MWVETASGVTSSRPELTDLFSHLRSGDTVVVWRLDRLGRSLPHLLETVESLEADGVGFRSLNESIHTTTSGGKAIYSIFGALAEFERKLIRERTQLGLETARAQGRLGGRPRLM
ncbi:recombinase family protein [Rhodococcus sp. G-MC3]|uniref:recombinase family protein n=1 Tax=Rhodococcus sp. G-MC3 TaxID=3046209 RepID=UPI0024B8B371|nr:recombinase family protein [Rhodococcus sp. G-MC3]MDJ0394583.1 recombinase family protein [Rhodococcus sp. G-MC3]